MTLPHSAGWAGRWLAVAISLPFSISLVLGASFAPPPPVVFEANSALEERAAPRSRMAAQEEYSIGQPTDEEQLYVELINRARANPVAEAERLRDIVDPEIVSAYNQFSVDFDLMLLQFAEIEAAPPLAMNGGLMAAARLHSLDMLNNQFQGHVSSDGSILPERAADQGVASFTTLGENVFAHGKSVIHGHAGFEVDWGESHDLLLMTIGNPGDLPNSGDTDVIVARDGATGDLHFRVFNAAGAKVVDRREGGFSEKAAEIAALKLLLETLWDKPLLLAEDQAPVFEAVTSITGYDRGIADGIGGMQEPPGHRLSIHNPDFREIGVGIVNGQNGFFGPQSVTQDFAARPGTQAFITGVTYYDLNGNNFYDIGEGLGGVRVEVEGLSHFAVSAESGGYSIPGAADGEYVVEFTGPNLAESRTIQVEGGANVKVDLALDYAPPSVVSGPVDPGLGIGNRYEFTAVSGVETYEWTVLRPMAVDWVEGAEEGLSRVTITSTEGYDVIQNEVVAAGQSTFHLAHIDREDQFIQFNDTFFAGSDAKIRFQAWLGVATVKQVGRVQVSNDDGRSWVDIWSVAGDSSGLLLPPNFESHEVSLADYAGDEIQVRVMYDSLGSPLFASSAAQIGFYIDDIEFSGVETAFAEGSFFTGDNQFEFTPAGEGRRWLRVRPRLEERAYPWSPLLTVVATDPNPEIKIRGLARAGGKAVMQFETRHLPPGLTFKVLAASELNGEEWAELSFDELVETETGDVYEATIDAAASARFFRVIKK